MLCTAFPSLSSSLYVQWNMPCSAVPDEYVVGIHIKVMKGRWHKRPHGQILCGSGHSVAPPSGQLMKLIKIGIYIQNQTQMTMNHSETKKYAYRLHPSQSFTHL